MCPWYGLKDHQSMFIIARFAKLRFIVIVPYKCFKNYNSKHCDSGKKDVSLQTELNQLHLFSSFVNVFFIISRVLSVETRKDCNCRWKQRLLYNSPHNRNNVNNVWFWPSISNRSPTQLMNSIMWVYVLVFVFAIQGKYSYCYTLF